MKPAHWVLAFLVAAGLCFGAVGHIAANDQIDGRARLISEYDDISGLQEPFDFRSGKEGDWPIVDFIKFAARMGDLNVVISPHVTGGSIKLMLSGVTIGEVLEIALAANNLAYEVKGSGDRSIINIMTDAEYRAKYGTSFYAQLEVRLFELQYVKPTRLAPLLQGMRSEIGRAPVCDDPSGTIVLIDTPAKVEAMAAFIEKVEVPLVEHVFELQYADPESVQQQVAPLLTEGIGRVTMDKRTRTIIINDLQRVIDEVTDMVRALDTKTRQVAMEARIVEVELSDKFSLGVDWQHVTDNLRPRYSLRSVAPLGASVAPSLTFKTVVGGSDMSLVVDALKTIGETKVIAKPHVSALDSGEATIKVVRNQPFRKIIYEPGTTNIVAVDYEFVEIGTILSVRPVINDEGFITVDIDATISELVDWYDAPEGSVGVIGIPVLKKAEARTAVTVKDGVTIIIGGMIKSEKRTTVVGIPVLSHVPLLGQLFRSTVEDQVRSETIVFLTPKIISGEEPFLELPESGKNLKLRTTDVSDVENSRAMDSRALKEMVER